MRKHRSLGIERLTVHLPALALAGALCLVVTSPALANFESAVAAYENGAYQDAQAEFEALADAGDGRATPYLERIREKLRQDRQAGGAGTSTFVDSIASIFEESGTAGDSSPSSTASRDAGSSTVSRSPAAAPGKTRSGGEPWSAFDTRIEPAPLPVSDVATPERRSIWSTLFHLPGTRPWSVCGTSHGSSMRTPSIESCSRSAVRATGSRSASWPVSGGWLSSRSRSGSAWRSAV